jgi:hypothetical protein
VDSFNKLITRGAGLRDVGYIELTADEVTDDVMLDIAKRGTTKLTGFKISRENRVRDVRVIEVQ